MLRTVNIPVELVEHVAHAQPRFVEDDLFLTHCDDPYYQLAFANPPIPASELLVGRAQFDEWFGRSGHRVSTAAQKANIGRRLIDLSIAYLPDNLLRTYCRDVANNLSHDRGEVYKIYKDTLTVAELGSFGLWDRMDDKIAALGGGGSIP